MSRPLRLEFAGALYHITSRGNERNSIYLQDDDFELFLDILGGVCKHYNWVVHSYCLMSNHYHLLVETPDANLSKGMRQLNGVFTQSMNRKHRRVGHLFQGRYKAIIVDKDNYLLELCRYIVLNPVRARMVDSPDEWLWSSWHCMLGNAESPEWLTTDALLLQFANNRADAIRDYVEFVRSGIGKKIWDELQHQIFLGDDAFVAKYQSMQDGLEGDLLEIPFKQRSTTPLTLEEYQSQSASNYEAIYNAYRSGCMVANANANEIGDLAFEWSGLKTLGLGYVVYFRTEKAKETTVAVKFYISSEKLDAKALLTASREYWSVENNLHWQLDVSMNEDACRIRQQNSTENLATARRISLNLFKHEKSFTGGIKRKYKQANRNDSYRDQVISGLSLL